MMKIITITPEELKQLISEVVSNELRLLVGQTIINNNTNDKIYYTRDEVSNILNVSLVTLHKWEKRKILLPVKIGKRVLYPKDMVDNRQINNNLTKSPLGDFSFILILNFKIRGIKGESVKIKNPKTFNIKVLGFFLSAGKRTRTFTPCGTRS
jgi:hypothetical protein